jgi:hypothetical protein
MLAKDAGFSSFEAYNMQRRYAGIPTEFGPPRRWVGRYVSLVNSQAWRKWKIQPDPDGTHSSHSLQSHSSLESGEAMDLHRIAYIDFKAALRWHILDAASRGHNLAPYIRSSPGNGGGPNVSGNKSLVYKLSFDTTETGARPLLMIGLIPHVFANSSVQSADNVIVLCLAKLSEDSSVLQDAIPNLEQTIKSVCQEGVRVGPYTFNVEIHIAADLKALWLAMNMEHFGCPFCSAEKGQFNDVIHKFEERFMNGRNVILGVPKDRIHLCALHAHLRIAERLIKCMALRAANADQTERDNRTKSPKLRVTRLKEFLRRFLKRTKFVITAKIQEAYGVGELVENGTLCAFVLG